MKKEYDLIVIGTGPAGEKAAVKAAYFKQRVAIVEKSEFFGGAGIQTGTLPSKTLKETAVYLSGIYSKDLFSIDRNLAQSAGIHDFMYLKNVVTDEAGKTVEINLRNHGVDIYNGKAKFINPHEIEVSSAEGTNVLYSKYYIIATGSCPVRPNFIPFDNRRIHDSDSILGMQRFPTSICVLGAGVIGCEYATIFASMGIKTSLVNSSDKILGFLDAAITDALVASMQNKGIDVIFNEQLDACSEVTDDTTPIKLKMKSGRSIETDMFLFAAGRSGNVAELNCEIAGINVGERNTIIVNSKFQTNVAHIYAVGDVIGFPALASTSMEQGRIAVSHIFKTKDLDSLTTVFPYGIYTIPEVSMVGITEEQARQQNLEYEIGSCYYSDTIRGKIMGDRDNGFLKLLFDKKTKVIMGVHIIGPLATEIIHFGMLAVKDFKTIDEIIATVFNFPTLHDLYKYACYDGLGNLAGRKLKKSESNINADKFTL
jgi:NAD(P) transhydrogenase